MTDMNSSLIGFLKKKSLFNNSPQKLKKSKDHSRDSKKFSQSQKSQKNININPERNIQLNNVLGSKNLQKHSSVQNFINNNVDEGVSQSVYVENTNRFQQKAPQQRQAMGKRNFNFRQQTEQTKTTKQLQKQEQNVKKIWTGIISKAVTFQSARIQSSQCLQGISVKLQTQISTINYKIDLFRNKINQVLNQQFSNLRDKIQYMVEMIFLQCQNNMKNYIKQQQRLFASELLNMRENLIKQYEKVEAMKQELKKPTWKKIAGQLLSSQLQQSVDQMLIKSKSINVRHWELKNLGESKLPSLQRQLKNVVKLSST